MTSAHMVYWFLVPQEHWLVGKDSGKVSVRESPLYHYHRYLLYCYARDQGNPELTSE